MINWEWMIIAVILSDDEDDLLWLPWQGHLSWKSQCLQGDHAVPGTFLVSITDWICAAELGGKVRVVRDLELVFALLLDKEFMFPFSVDGTSVLHMRTPESMFQRPTLAMMLRPVQIAMKCIHPLFSFVIRTTAKPNIGCVHRICWHASVTARSVVESCTITCAVLYCQEGSTHSARLGATDAMNPGLLLPHCFAVCSNCKPSEL